MIFPTSTPMKPFCQTVITSSHSVEDCSVEAGVFACSAVALASIFDGTLGLKLLVNSAINFCPFVPRGDCWGFLCLCHGLFSLNIRIGENNTGWMYMKQFSGEKLEEGLEYILKRRSVPAHKLVLPAPDKGQLEVILQAGARVPDHKKMCPWYFLVFEGGQCVKVAGKISALYSAENPHYKAEHLEIESRRFTRAPLVIGVVSRIREGRAPMWEQVLSCGAVCMNVVLAANMSGFGANWITEWYSYNSEFKDYLGLDVQDHIAGFIHIGSVEAESEERERPNMEDIVTYWEEGVSLNKGDCEESAKIGFPAYGFDFSMLK